MESTAATRHPLTFGSNRCLALSCSLWIVLLSACAPLKPPPGKGIFWAPSAPIELPLALGYTGLRRGRVSRDSTGDHLFLQYYDSARQNKVFVVSADGIQIKDLPGPSAFDAEGNAVWWLTDSWRFEFATGYVTPTNTYAVDVKNFTDGKYIALRRSPEVTWVALAESPLTELVLLPSNATLDMMIYRGDRLYLAYDISRVVAYCSEYEVSGKSAKLVRTRKVRWAGVIYDFDPDSGLFLAQSAFGKFFSHALLADINTRAHKRIRPKWGDTFFVKDSVIKQYGEALKKAEAK